MKLKLTLGFAALLMSCTAQTPISVPAPVAPVTKTTPRLVAESFVITAANSATLTVTLKNKPIAGSYVYFIQSSRLDVVSAPAAANNPEIVQITFGTAPAVGDAISIFYMAAL